MSSSPNKYEKLVTLRDFSPEAISEETTRRIQVIKTQFETEFMPRVQLARAEGVEEGKKLGEAAARASIQPVLDTFHQAMQAAAASQNTHLARLEALSLELLALYLPQLVGSLAAQSPETLMKETLHKVLQRLDGTHQPTLFVAPGVESTTRQLCQDSAFADTLGKLVIKADTNLKPGDCRMQWQNHGHEINLGALLQEIVTALQGQAAAITSALPVEQLPETAQQTEQNADPTA